MYNYSMNLSYRKASDTKYRKDLLDAFNMTEYNDDIINQMSLLYNEVKPHYKEIITVIKPKHPLSPFNSIEDADCFMFLFAWEYFYEMHQLLVEINKKGDKIGEKQQILMDKIRGTK